MSRKNIPIYSYDTFGLNIQTYACILLNTSSDPDNISGFNVIVTLDGRDVLETL